MMILLTTLILMNLYIFLLFKFFYYFLFINSYFKLIFEKKEQATENRTAPGEKEKKIKTQYSGFYVHSGPITYISDEDQ